MGEAKRRQDRDQSYGKVYNLASSAQKQRHCKSLANQLAEVFRTELTYLLNSQEEPDDFNDICQQVEYWLKNKLKNYKEPDRAIIISFLLVTYQSLKSDDSLDLVGKLINCASRACLSEKVSEKNQKFNEQLGILVQMMETEPKIKI